jgi:hypothetical protein
MMPHRVLHILGTAQPEGTGIARVVAALALPCRELNPIRDGACATQKHLFSCR